MLQLLIPNYAQFRSPHPALCTDVPVTEAGIVTSVCVLLSIPHGAGYWKRCQWLYPPSTEAPLRGLLSQDRLNTQRYSPLFTSPSFAFCQSCLFSPFCIGLEQKKKEFRPSVRQGTCIRCPPDCERGGEVMSQRDSCCRLCSRGFYSCHWSHPSENKRRVSVCSHAHYRLNVDK